MLETETVKKAKSYIDKMANGINPINNMPVSEYDSVNNVKVSRCLFYVSDILRQVIENGGVVAGKKKPKEDFYITFETIQKFSFSDTPISLSEIAKKINELTDNENMKKLSYSHLSNWLISIEILHIETAPGGKSVKRPAESGKNLGITVEERLGFHGPYTAVLYNNAAQHFIIDNIDAVIAMMHK